MRNNKKRAGKRNSNRNKSNKKSQKSKLSQTYLQLIYRYITSLFSNLVSHNCNSKKVRFIKKINKNYLFLNIIILLIFLASGFSSLALNIEHNKINLIEKKENNLLEFKSLLINDIMMIKIFKNNNIFFNSENKDKASNFNSFEGAKVMPKILEMLYRNFITRSYLFHFLSDCNCKISIPLPKFVKDFFQIGGDIKWESHSNLINLFNSFKVIRECGPFTMPLIFFTYSSLTSSSSIGSQLISSQNFWSSLDTVPVFKNSSNILFLFNSSLLTSDQFTQRNLDISDFNSESIANVKDAIYITPLFTSCSNFFSCSTLLLRPSLATPTQFTSGSLSNFSFNPSGIDNVILSILVPPSNYFSISNSVYIFKPFVSNLKSLFSLKKVSNLRENLALEFGDVLGLFKNRQYSTDFTGTYNQETEILTLIEFSEEELSKYQLINNYLNINKILLEEECKGCATGCSGEVRTFSNRVRFPTRPHALNFDKDNKYLNLSISTLKPQNLLKKVSDLGKNLNSKLDKKINLISEETQENQRFSVPQKSKEFFRETKDRTEAVQSNWLTNLLIRLNINKQNNYINLLVLETLEKNKENKNRFHSQVFVLAKNLLASQSTNRNTKPYINLSNEQSQGRIVRLLREADDLLASQPRGFELLNGSPVPGVQNSKSSFRSKFNPKILLKKVSNLRQNLGLEFGRVFGSAQNKLKGNIWAFGSFCFLFLNFSDLGNESRVGRKKKAGKNKKKSNKISSLFHECFSLSKRKSFRDYYINELLAFLFILFFFVLAFYLGPSITGFTIISHTADTDFTGTYNRINKLKYLTKQIKKRGVK